jgi:hypothetical protein
MRRPEVVREFTYPAETRAQWHEVERAVLGAVILDESGGGDPQRTRAAPDARALRRRETTPRCGGAILALADQHVRSAISRRSSQELTRARNCLNAVGGLSFSGTSPTTW